TSSTPPGRCGGEVADGCLDEVEPFVASQQQAAEQRNAECISAARHVPDCFDRLQLAKALLRGGGDALLQFLVPRTKKVGRRRRKLRVGGGRRRGQQAEQQEPTD